MAELLVDGNEVRRPEEEQFRMEGWIACAPCEDLLGIRIEKAAEGKAVLSMPFTVKLAQGGGFMHGGALTTLGDTAVAMAIKSVLPGDTLFATTALHMEFVAPVKEGPVRAEAAVTGPVHRVFQGAATLFDAGGGVVARLETQFKVARGQGFDD
ncbi:PaaI family thioesterase [Desulfuromonas sp. AOP6]|uniref:PaaI family thioesterase n=1 Tax=Desulfuromonas sp. AOP6 TaxID=1566351 RepID=UPI0012742861|nr:PaaI family thioesterase [Desulfuromonas sp. AOP6]BCA79590.1 acyl-CoA thioesterase [Desulfuromonas sp. AOP6]